MREKPTPPSRHFPGLTQAFVFAVVTYAGKVLHQGRPEMHGAQPATQVQLHQSQVPGGEGDGLTAAAGVLRQAQPLLRGQGERPRHGGDDSLPGPLP